ncbi:c-type cytochrome [Zhouia sp. PK063]|uniref:c-type cytochrome n=1 Tax=Zhouia sp. PK063 TaxID=3373602 RepID=UPI003795963C
MKLLKTFMVLSLAIALTSCGGKNEKKKEKFSYENNGSSTTTSTTSEDTQAKDGDGVPASLDNTGVGPVKELTLDGDIDQAMVDTGKKIFLTKCTACHKTDARFIGPALKGVFERRNPAWVMNMILNPDEMLKEDPTAIALLKQYNNTAMLQQNLTQDEARSVVEYLRSL